MAKRKRLTPANPDYLSEDGGLTPKQALSPSPLSRAPIADVASEASSRAALAEVSEAMSRARAEGRLVLSLSLDAIDLTYLARDRISVNDEEMAALKSSLAARGQQTPVEVVELKDGHYGLISGWRRCRALSDLGQDTVLALLRAPSEMSEAYLAMVEENEIRANLSHFERARIAAKAVDQGVFPSEKKALLELFGTASRAKRSKIRSFLPLVRVLGGVLQHPEMISERLGLALSKRLEGDAKFSRALVARLSTPQERGAEAETRLLQEALKKTGPKPGKVETAKTQTVEIHAGLHMRRRPETGHVELSGRVLTDDFVDRLETWLRREAAKK